MIEGCSASAVMVLGIYLRKKGLEPLRPFGHQLLRLARLPIPPLPHRLARFDYTGELDSENSQTLAKKSVQAFLLLTLTAVLYESGVAEVS